MIPSLIITLRETLEMALIVGIVLSYLSKINQKNFFSYVYGGVFAGIVFSLIGAFLFSMVAGGFSGRIEKIFEGMTMLIGAVLLTTMLFWMLKQKNISGELERQIDQKLKSSQGIGIFFVVFISILREGIEMVIFLQATSAYSDGNSSIGALAGIVLACFVGYLFFFSVIKINLKKFFSFSTIILMLFAAGLVAHGVHELQEAGVIPVIVEHVWDINPIVMAEGEYSLLHEKGVIGSILKGLFGYNGNPSLLEVISYLFYGIFSIFLWILLEGKAQQKPRLSSAA